MALYSKIIRLSLLPAIALFLLFSSSTGIARISPEKTLIIGGDKNFAPFEFINKQGVPDGYTVDIMNAVARNQGLNIKIVLDTWSKAYHDLKDGRIDAVTGLLYSKERDNTFDFSAPHFIMSYALFKRKEGLIKSLEDFKDKEVIVVTDVYAHEWLVEQNITKSIIPVEDPTAALLLLASGKHDAVVLPRLHGVNLLDELKIDNVDTFGPPVLEQRFCFAVASGNATLLAELNDGLFAIQKSGEYDEIFLKWASVVKKSREKRKILIYVLLFLSVILCALFLVGFWNWLLKRTVRLKTKELRQSEMRLSAIVEGIPIPTYVVDENHIVTHWNKACELLTGESSAKIVGTKNHNRALFDTQAHSIVDLLLDNVLSKNVQQHDSATYRESSVLSGAYETERFCSNLGVNGRWLYGSAALLRDDAGTISGAIETWQDLTESKQLERQLVQSQKMEALGTLAGGIAHDFNNILSVLIGNAELANLDLPKDSALKNYLGRILSAAQHAKTMVKQILAFSRQAEIKTEAVHISSIVQETLELVNVSLPHNISVSKNIQTDALVMVDASHIHQIVMNLCTNALHAMKDTGGTLRVSLNEVRVDETQASRDFCLIPGDFIKLTVSDTGHGIPRGIQGKVLDPFFTTKKRGEGTGMGLSVTHGIVQQCKGIIELDSDPGKGTIFNVYLPKYVVDHS